MSATIGGSSAAPNWYPDPGDARFLRYWDGAQWTEHTSPATPEGVGPAAAPPQGGGSRKTMWIVLGSVVGGLILIGGILAAIAMPVFLSQREKAADTSAKADVATLGKEIATWYVDNDGPPPAVVTEAGHYYVDGVAVAPVSPNVTLGGQTGSGATDWCVWVTNPEGDVENFRYSAYGGLYPGTC